MIFRKSTLSIFLCLQSLFVFAASKNLTPSDATLSQPWVEWNSVEGSIRLNRSKAKAGIFNLLRFYESQITPTYCGVATATVALNSLEIEPPYSEILQKYRMFNQTEFFSDKIKKITTSERVTKNGISLEEMKSIFKMFPINVASYEGVNTPADEMRTRMIEALQHPNQAVLVLYSRATAQQEGKGHWSPIAAYDAESDSFLLLDVAKYKYPPTWIPAEILIAAMQTKDPIGRPRGLIILQAPTETSDKKSCS